MAEGRTTTETTKNGDKHMKKLNKYVGLDVHKDTTVMAIANVQAESRPLEAGSGGLGLCFFRRSMC